MPLVTAIDPFRFDAGTPWLNLLATVGNRFSPAPVERLSTPERLAEWLDHEGLTPPVPPTEADLAAAYELRAALVHVVFALIDGEPVPVPALDLVQDVAARDRPARLSVAGDGLRAEPVRDPLARLARLAVDHLAAPGPHHLRVCGDADCTMAYLDPYGRRRWCGSGCGVRARVRAHRERGHG
jgi:predicted RNA-binding Zn ribbon-like protein